MATPSRRAGAAVALVLAAAGCAGGTEPAAPTTTTTTAVDAVTACTNQLAYWAREALRNARDTGLDYQEMGLSGDQYDALLALLGKARELGAQATPNWIAEQARAACTRLAAAPSTSHAPGWP
ncbi:hypothetical protein GCM10010174_82890 [Kutzneria viridogrisea]|uniref:ABC-type glycerol-3-phosphate transport system substrate-binding protein n=1 Tax=Kutzneria viridogrisea TaxID=47990 RepID=A0ABR6BEQ4_9PSEU|nr:ABC-type glycerol-3-phosphate transport system substrate-binding protein [Kutzneria viridogrisea]